MTPKVLYPDWKDVVEYAAQGAQPHILVET